MSDSSSTNDKLPRSNATTLGRFLFPVLAFFFIVDALPWTWSKLNPLKRAVNSITSPLGIWQNEWALFAPNPVVANSWITADIRLPDGTVVQWQDTYWANATAWEKFANFRMLNYTNRVQIPSNFEAGNDLAAFIARGYAKENDLAGDTELAASGLTVTVYSNGASLVMPEDGSFPKPEDQTWITFSNVIGRFPLASEPDEAQAAEGSF